VTLADRMQQAYLRAGLLFSLDIELTYRCPLACTHCYQRGTTRSELATEQWLEVLAQARDLNVFNVGFTGGEVFLRPDFPQLLQAAAKLGLRLFVNTSGNGASAEALATLMAVRPAQVDVSFYAADAARHDAVTGRPGSFVQSLRVVRELAAAGLFVRAALTPLAGFVEDATAVSRDLLALGVPKVALNRFDPTLCSDPDATSHLVPTTRAPVRCEGDVLLSPPSAPDTGRICGGGTTSLLVHPNGKVVPCHGMATVLGDLTTQTLAAIWHDSAQRKRIAQRRRSDLPECAQCGHWDACGFCPGEAERITGDWRLPAASFCCKKQGP
jgi:radical SAM protein with 4Fe4S-binding SPASM domain